MSVFCYGLSAWNKRDDDDDDDDIWKTVADTAKVTID